MSNKDHEKEISRHNLGTLCFLGGLGLIILVCFAMHGGTASAVLGMVGVGGILAGLLLWAHNRSAAQIREQQMLAGTNELYGGQSQKWPADHRKRSG